LALAAGSWLSYLGSLPCLLLLGETWLLQLALGSLTLALAAGSWLSYLGSLQYWLLGDLKTGPQQRFTSYRNELLRPSAMTGLLSSKPARLLLLGTSFKDPEVQWVGFYNS
jgi:hypothetical protein